MQAEKRKVQTDGLLMAQTHAYHPKDMEHDGEAYYARLIQSESEQVERLVARLMGNFIFLSDATPVQTKAGLAAVRGQQL